VTEEPIKWRLFAVFGR